MLGKKGKCVIEISVVGLENSLAVAKRTPRSLEGDLEFPSGDLNCPQTKD